MKKEFLQEKAGRLSKKKMRKDESITLAHAITHTEYIQ
jgi:hypothetical protein